MPSEYRDALAALLRREALPRDKHGHQPRLYALTRQIGANVVYDDDVVFAAAYLHDLGVFIGHRPEDPQELSRWNHVIYTCEQAPRLLGEMGFPEEKIPAVIEAIQSHQPADEPHSMEAIILRDADILEQLGAIGILRAVAKVGRDTRYATYSPVMTFLERNLRELPAKIRLDTTRELAAPKLQVLADFLEAVRAESQGHLD